MDAAVQTVLSGCIGRLTWGRRTLHGYRISISTAQRLYWLFKSGGRVVVVNKLVVHLTASSTVNVSTNLYLKIWLGSDGLSPSLIDDLIPSGLCY